MNVEQLSKKIKELDGDIYLITETIKNMESEIKNLNSKYESLLNRVKCTECHNNKSSCS